MLRSHLCFPSNTILRSVQTRNFITASRPVRIRARPPRVVPQENLTKPETFNKPVEELSTPQRSRKSPTRIFFRTLKESIQSSKDQEELITSRVKEHVDCFSGQYPCPPNFYDKVIRFLLGYSCIPAAVAVYDRAVAEGFIISPPVAAQILVVSSFTPGKKSKARIPSSLERIIKMETFDFNDLQEVLHWMMQLDLPSEILLRTTSIFYESHPSAPVLFEPAFDLYKQIIRLGVRDGYVWQALGALSFVLPQSNFFDKANVADAYASFLAAIRRTVYPDRNAVSAAIKQMQKQGINANLSVWNALLAYEVRTNSLHRPFAIYEALKNSPEFLPDDFTFGSLFNALNRFYNPKRRRYRHDMLLPSNIPSPRVLYREMVEALIRNPNDPPFHLTTSLLNVTLRSFVYSKDYAGAYVVIRAFSTFDVPVDAKTYFIVFRHLMNRITYGIRAVRKASSDIWADRFLSLPYPIPNSDFLVELELDTELAHHILNISKCRSFKLDTPLYITPQPLHGLEQKKYFTPSVEAMLGTEILDLDENFDAVPLERLLKKALLAELESMRELGGEECSASSYLFGKISDAKKVMVPSTLNRRLKKMRTKMRVLESL